MGIVHSAFQFATHHTLTLAIIKKMRKSLIIITLLLSSLNILARCGSYGLTAFPSNDIVSLNSNFTLQGYAQSQGIIDSLNIKYPIYLISENQKIGLIVVEINVGMYSIKQVVLRPSSPLQPNTTYELRIDNLPDFHQSSVSKYDEVNFIRKDAKWTTNSNLDNIAPQFLKLPKFKENVYKEKGCGPDMYSVFKLKTDDKESSLVKVELREIIRRDTITHTYYLRPTDNGELRVGRRMCSGEFTYERKYKYQIRFSLFDYSGNTNGQWTDWVKHEPYEK